MTFAQAIESIIEFENQVIEETPDYVVKITIEWSESECFESGQVFTSVKSFESTVRKAAMLAKVYDKTKYTVTWSNGDNDTYRTDCGDDYTYNYDFYSERKQYREYLLANPSSMKAHGADEQTLRDTLEALKKMEVFQRELEG